MKKFILCAVAAALILSVTVAYAACTPEEAQQKAMQVSTQLQALAQKDAARFQKLMQEFQEKSQDLATKNDMDAVCKYYDEMIQASK